MSSQAAEPVAELRDVSVIFNRDTAGEVKAMRNLNLVIQPGEYVSIIGPNGAGKSTLINVLAGAIKPTKGTVQIDGMDVTRLGAHRRARWISRVFQDPKDGTAETMTVRENLAIASMRGSRRSPFRPAFRADRLEAGRQMLHDYGSDIANRFGNEAGTLSGGQRQLLSLIMAVLQRPYLLLMDEHVAALDPQMAGQVMERTDALIKDQELTAVMITHNMRSAARYGNRLLIMAGGEVIEDISAAEKAELTEEGLVARFREIAANQLTDRMLGE
jgi:putative ABC transport system ATP-binding protein